MSISVISVKTMLEVLSPDCHTSQRVGSREIVGQSDCHSELQLSTLQEPRVTWKDETLAEELPPADWPVGTSVW